jgi:phosphoribosyl-ATP pyrophosphohydrolase/phosphoribosyl-AMP cyclohydrolase
MTVLADSMDWAKSGGLLPLIAQHAHDGRVLMVGCTNPDAMALTLATGEAHFWSRTRQRIWRKGETSGHTLRVVSMAADCDRDALLCQVLPAGPTCHRGTQSCFDGDGPAHPWLNQLDALIASRASGSGPGYVTELLSGPVSRRAQKVGEEAVETALAAVSGSADALRSEAADLLFHLMVLLRGNGLSLADVAGELAKRHHRKEP